LEIGAMEGERKEADGAKESYLEKEGYRSD
jgi:hypothetical protein